MHDRGVTEPVLGLDGEFDRFVEVVRQGGRYWLAINLPPGRG